MSYHQHHRFLLPLVLVLGITINASAQNSGMPSNPVFGRKYKTGESYKYRLTTNEYHNGKWALTTIVVCELKVAKDSLGIPYDEIHWIQKKLLTPTDTIDQVKAALAVKPYRVSLDGRGRIDIPKIEVPEMTGAIQDFNTFLVAISPLMAGMDKIKMTGDSLVIKDNIKADFSNGANIIKGYDCFSVLIKMSGSTKNTVLLHSAFRPPLVPCLTYITSDMNTPVVKDTLNNFQMVGPAGKDLYNVNYGREYFYINSTIRKLDGKISKAEMVNLLNLKVKVNCDTEYKNCQVEVPFAEKRELTLELL